MFSFNLIIILILSNFIIIRADISDKEYANTPDLFHIDNYDKCMLLKDEAFYCNFIFELQPLNEARPSETWIVIKNLSAGPTNYRHDLLRHWICVPKTCPGIGKTDVNDVKLIEHLNKCYNEKVEKFGVAGTIKRLRCEGISKESPLDWVDVAAIILIGSYVILVLLCTFIEGVFRYKNEDEFNKFNNSSIGKLIGVFSITKNWIRLNTVNCTEEVEKLRFVQGVRVYNTCLVICSHTILTIIANPISNTKNIETMYQKVGAIVFSNGHLCVGVFFFTSAFLLSNSMFDYMKRKTLSISSVLYIFFNRLFRLTPAVFVVVLLHATILRHLGNGPFWNEYMENESKRCKKNGWTNLIYLNNWIDPYNMCLPVTWYLATDTQHFFLGLLFLWFLKSNEKYIWWILAVAIPMNMIASFLQNYYYDFTALNSPTAEKYYQLNFLFTSDQHQYQLGGFIGNMAPILLGIAFGYYFHKHKFDKKPLFEGKISLCVWWMSTFVLSLSVLLIPGHFILNPETTRNRIWASIYVALARPFFIFGIGCFFIGVSEGVGWLARRAVVWGPTYILGRITFSAYLIHMSVLFLRCGKIRGLIYMNDFVIFSLLMGDLALSYLLALLLTLFIELPLSALQKLIFQPPKNEVVYETKKE